VSADSYRGDVRITEFWRRMEARYGAAYARSYAADQVLSTLGSRTVERALADGDDVKSVWRAVCEAEDVPVAER
jgi:hypothetical protein